MLPAVRTVRVPLGNRSYDIKIAPGLISKLGAECARLKLGHRCAIITDTNVGREYAKPAYNSLLRTGFEPSLVIVPAGDGGLWMGADRGIDGNVWFGKTSRAIVSVKAGDNVGVGMIRDLHSVIEDHAPAGVSVVHAHRLIARIPVQGGPFAALPVRFLRQSVDAAGIDPAIVEIEKCAYCDSEVSRVVVPTHRV